VLAVAGIYETGLLEYDREFIFVPYRKLQRAARTGVEAQPAVAGDTVAASTLSPMFISFASSESPQPRIQSSLLLRPSPFGP
jgi:hypothetical protein